MSGGTAAAAARAWGRRVESAFDAAAEQPTPEQARTVVQQLCGDDPELLAYVSRLVENHLADRKGAFFAEPTQTHAWTATATTAPGTVEKSSADEDDGDDGDDGDNADEADDAPADPPAEAAADRELPAYTLIDDYRILSRLDRGNMGAVYRAVDERLNKVVAIKVIRPGRLSPGSRQRFLEEAQVLAQLDDPCIARVLRTGFTRAGMDAHADPVAAALARGGGIDTDGGGIVEQPYLAMEFVDGVTLAARLKSSPPLTDRQKLELLERVCRAVDHANNKGIFHRDLKPTNIMVQTGEVRTGWPKVVDFGIARVVPPPAAAAADGTGALSGSSVVDSSATAVGAATADGEHGQPIGTWLYMPPEQALGQHAKVDATSDVYALGGVAYEAFAGRPPLPLRRLRRRGQSLILAICNRVPKPLRHHAPTADRDVETIVAKALAKDQRDRYPDARRWPTTCGRLLEHRPIAAGEQSWWNDLVKFVRRHRPSVAVVAALLVLLVASLAWALASAADDRAQRRAAVASAARADAQRDEAEHQRAAADAHGHWPSGDGGRPTPPGPRPSPAKPIRRRRPTSSPTTCWPRRRRNTWPTGPRGTRWSRR